MRNNFKNIYKMASVAMLAIAVASPGCGSSDVGEPDRASISATNPDHGFEEKLASVSWFTHTVSGDLIIKNPPGRDPSVPLSITEVFPDIALTREGGALSVIPADIQQLTVPLRLVATGDIILDNDVHLRIPGSLHLKGHRIIVKEGAQLDLSGKLFIEAAVYSGHGSIIASAEWSTLTVSRQGRDGTRGTDGSNGKAGADSTCYLLCGSGTDGGDGANGTNATDGGEINLKVDLLDSSTTFLTTGGNGGDGGNGGEGGRGGYQSCCAVFWCHEGCTGGVGGKAGNGGDGGQGGNITVQYCTRSSSRPTFDASGGKAGNGGLRGTGGEPSNGGCAIAGCRTSFPKVDGTAGKPGHPGWDGFATVLRRNDCP